jgi:uncharacterized protein YutE (UPF0331/DUF86 family)
MRDDVILNKSANIEKCLERVKEEYIGFESEFETNFTKQDSIILNLLRACEAAIDIANHIIKLKQLGIPQATRDSFALLENAGLLPALLSENLQKMVGFRNLAVHSYTKISISITRNIIEQHLKNFTDFTSIVLKI